eukprot:CAMPEP_0198236008 /NCGR_PEP_ID=MMETSP1446-20131203/1931_1 /TAXON_ID=1461542 ORGANISM="Unidentified sp, Strain CCMP2111" /NCGR_SAMPLE_ID=MMETSP1446 /ASSEMBLY_ACC=CAM_ASM_001112 /LENGTH=595 /DNA_ID=CAMNT_0043917547 /DNA_START=45 /DNA_END=1832 /DNA_ORIENTATION=-
MPALSTKACFAAAAVAALLAPLPKGTAGGSPVAELAALVCLRLALLCAVVVAYVSVPMVHALWRYRSIPGPWPLPVFGNAIAIRKGNIDEVYAEWEKRYGGVFKWFLCGTVVIVCSDLELARELCLRKFSDFMNHAQAPESVVAFFPKAVHKQFKLGLDVAQGMYWKGLRSTASSIFHNVDKMTTFRPLMSGAANELADRLGDVKDGQVVDIWKALGDMTLDVVGSTVFGIRFNCIKNKSSDAVKAARLLISSFEMKFSSNPYLGIGVMLPPLTPILVRLGRAFPTKQMKELEWASAYLASLSSTMFDKAARTTGNNNSNVGASGKDTTGVAGAPSSEYEYVGESFLKLFIEAHNRETGDSLNKDEVTAQAFIFLLAGYDTTANTLAFAIYLLTKNKDKEAAMIEEIDRLSNTEVAALDDMEEYEYVEAVVKESLRLYGPAPLTDRVATRTTEVKGYTIHKETPVHIPFRNLHHNAKHFPDPEKFLPERFLPRSNEYGKQNRRAFVPWGMGPRMCVASNFALTEAKLALITLYKKYTFSLSPSYTFQPKMKATLNPTGGVQVLVHRRVLPTDLKGLGRRPRRNASIKNLFRMHQE